MKAKEIIKDLLRDSAIAQDCGIFELLDSQNIQEFDEQIKDAFGEEVGSIIANKPIKDIVSGTYIYGYSDSCIMLEMPDIILRVESADATQNGKCIFLWYIDNED